MAALRANRILCDREGDGEFFQIYTHGFADRFFFEIVERRTYQGFGAANALSVWPRKPVNQQPPIRPT
jgi:4-hydroxyphenylpyruvate dioxygenase